jgi:hypothetical protein
MTSPLEDLTRFEASRNCWRSCSRETDSSSNLSERRITSVLDRDRNNRRSPQDLGMLLRAKRNRRLSKGIDFHAFLKRWPRTSPQTFMSSAAQEEPIKSARRKSISSGPYDVFAGLGLGDELAQ